ncbi:MAG: hypothetical protein HYX55_02500 [Chloroflexi bacterium]|nr:hypothetical protein [Chloroflexota bacterium]
MTIDVGTGDGRAVLAVAAHDPRTLAIGLDANAAAMAESSRRAAGPARKGGLPNAAFIVAAAEAPPAALGGVADVVTVQFPWGSLLRGCVGRAPIVAAGLAGLVAPGGAVELLLAPSARDGLAGIPLESDAIAGLVRATFAPHGFELACARPATAAEIARSGSTWARRLRRSAQLLRLAHR